MIEQLHTMPGEHIQPDTCKRLLPSLRRLGVTLAENIKRGIIRQPSKPIFPEGIYFDGNDCRLKSIKGDRVSSDEILQFCKAVRFYDMFEEIEDAFSTGTKLQLKSEDSTARVRGLFFFASGEFKSKTCTWKPWSKLAKNRE